MWLRPAIRLRASWTMSPLRGLEALRDGACTLRDGDTDAQTHAARASTRRHFGKQCGFFLWDDPARSRKQQAINRALVEAASELSADTLVIIGGGLHDMGPQDAAADLLRARATLEAELPSLMISRAVMASD